MRYLAPVVLLAFTVVVVCCSSPKQKSRSYSSRTTRGSGTYSYAAASSTRTSSSSPTYVRSAGPRVTPAQMLQEVRLYTRLVPKGKHARRQYRPMTPRFITIHSTQNPRGDAWAHTAALNNGRLKDSWHFTVQENLAIQHLPTTEQGRHADFGAGPGNSYSIGIEMCEHRGNNIARTIDRTARLTAYLMHQHKIPLRNVVPHYHWPRRGKNPPNKNCPHFLLDNGRPGRKWQTFLRIVETHYRRISSADSVLVQR